MTNTPTEIYIRPVLEGLRIRTIATANELQADKHSNVSDLITMVLTNEACANRLEYIIRTFFEGHVGFLARCVIPYIRYGPEIQDFWDSRSIVWRGLAGIRQRGPEEAQGWALPNDAGINISSSIQMMYLTCIGNLGTINPMTRYLGIYALTHIAIWLCEYIDLYSGQGDDVWNSKMRPFYPIDGEALGLLNVTVDMIWAILYTMSIGERELLTKEILHLRIMQALHLLNHDLRRSEERRDNYIFNRYGVWMDSMPIG